MGRQMRRSAAARISTASWTLLEKLSWMQYIATADGNNNPRYVHDLCSLLSNMFHSFRYLQLFFCFYSGDG